MSNSGNREKGEKTGMSGDELFIRKARAMFEQSAAGLDAETQSRLNRSRKLALDELESRSLVWGNWSQWVPATGLATAAAVAVVMWNTKPVVEPIVLAPVSDFEILLNEDSLDMLQDLEFYSWIDIDGELDDEASEDSNVG